MWSALGIVSALLEREKTGRGTVVDSSLYETALGYIGYHLVGYLADGTVPTGQGTTFPMVAPYQVFPTRDGELMVAGGNDRLFGLLCEELELPELVTDERFRTNPDRVRNREALVALVSARLRERDTADWRERLTAAGVPAAPVADVADVANCRADAGTRHPPAARARDDPGSAPAGAPALVRPRARDASLRPACGRRAHGRDPRRDRLLGRGDRRARLGRRHSYAIASSGSSLAARRAGKIAAMIPTTIAAIEEDDDLRRREREDEEVDLDDEQAREDEPEHDADRRADERRDDALVSDHAPHLATRHADGAKHPDLAGPLEDRQDERVHDPEEADDHGEREQDVEDVQDLLERPDLARR